MTPPANNLISARDLAKRWNITQKTLANWRWMNKGPKFVKIGYAVLYRLEDVIQYEGTHEAVRINE